MKRFDFKYYSKTEQEIEGAVFFAGKLIMNFSLGKNVSSFERAEGAVVSKRDWDTITDFLVGIGNFWFNKNYLLVEVEN